jgi:hypothetical protein
MREAEEDGARLGLTGVGSRGRCEWSLARD